MSIAQSHIAGAVWVRCQVHLGVNIDSIQQVALPARLGCAWWLPPVPAYHSRYGAQCSSCRCHHRSILAVLNIEAHPNSYQCFICLTEYRTARSGDDAGNYLISGLEAATEITKFLKFKGLTEKHLLFIQVHNFDLKLPNNHF